MHWKELRGFYFPIFMEEINKVKTKYLNLIQQIQKTNQEKDRKLYIELRKSIEARIIEVEVFIEENFDKQFVLHFEKGNLKLKKLLQITPREKLTKQTLNKNFRDIDVLNKVLKKNQEKKKKLEKEKSNEPIYNKLPVEYELYENLIESMKYEELKNKNKYKGTKFFGEKSISNESQSQENSHYDSPKFKNTRLSFGQINNNYIINNNNIEKDGANLKNSSSLKSKENTISNKKKNKK